MDDTACVRIRVVYSSGPRNVQEVHLQMPLTSTVADAVRASHLIDAVTNEALDDLTLSVWGRKVSTSQLLRTGDRVEMVRPLLVDPKVARRERFTRQGAKAAGLFASRRPGAKAGY